MKTVRHFAITGVSTLCLLFAAAPAPAATRGYTDTRINASQRADRALYGNRIRIIGSGNYRGARRGTHPPAASFSGRTVDPYKIGPTMDGVEIDLSKMTAATQRRLTARGYDAGPANGQWTDALEQALHGFQADVSGTSTGVIDSYTLENLGLSALQFAK